MIFNTREAMGTTTSYSWVSFSIPTKAWLAYCYSTPKKAFNPTLLRCLIKDAEIDSGGK